MTDHVAGRSRRTGPGGARRRAVYGPDGTGTHRGALVRAREKRSMRRERISCKLSFSLGLAVVLVAGVSLIPSVASADEEVTAHDHATDTSGLQDDLAGLRRATARFHRVEEAIAAGYELGWVNGSGMRILTGCVSHPTAGAMGYHYINPDLVADNAVDALEPEALVYAPAPDGGLKLVAVEWIVRGPNTNPPGVPTAPSVLGMDMHILVPAVGFWLEHAWIWAHNPAGMFADWNPEVSCP